MLRKKLTDLLILLTLPAILSPALSEEFDTLDSIVSHYKMSEMRMLEGDFDAAITLAEPLVDASRKVAGENNIHTARLLMYLGTLHRRKGDLEQAESLYKDSLEIIDRLTEVTPDERSILLTTLATINLELNDHVEAVEFNEQLLILKESQYGETHQEVAYTLVDIALSSERLQQWGKAINAFQRALAILEKSASRETEAIVSILNNLARIHERKRDYDKVLPHYEQALELLKEKHGDKHADVASLLNNIANFHHSLGDHDQAMAYYRQSLDIRKATVGAEHAGNAPTLNSMAVLAMDQGDYPAARQLLEEAVAIQEKADPASLTLSSMLSNLALLNAKLQNFEIAENQYRQALMIRETQLGEDHADVAILVSNLATLYLEQARYARASEALERALAIQLQAFGQDHPETASTLNNLAYLYLDQGDYDKALPLLQRSLDSRERILGREHPDLNSVLANLANIHFELGNFDKAEALFRRALAINENAFGRQSPGAASMLNALAAIANQRKAYDEARPLFEEVLTIYRGLYGDRHPKVALVLNNLASLASDQGAFNKAEQHYREALDILRENLGNRHPDTAAALDNLGYLYLEQQRMLEALPIFRTSMEIRIARQLQATLDMRPRKADEIEQNRHVFRYFLQAARQVAEEDSSRYDALANESYLASQWLNQTGAEAALAQMSLRFASGSDSLARALRDYQDRQQAYKRIDDQWIAALGKEQLEMPLDRLTALRASRDEADSTLLMMADRLLTDFPDYMELASPRPIDVQNVRELLREGEAIVHFAFGNEHSHLFLVNRNDYLWMPLDIGRAELRQRIRKLRMALDPTAAVNAETGTPLLQRTRFDLELAYRLYNDLLGPVEKGLEAIDHLYFVPSDALTALPPAVLVTEPPRRLGGMRANNLAEWLIKRHAITVLPSVSSLKALRRFAGSERANRPFAGIGNPLLDASPAPGSGQRGIGSVFEGSLADPASLKKLGNLPQTEREIRQLASLLGAGEQDLFLGEGANETRIKQYKLDDYRIVAFATHGLLAGELEGLSEPGLVLTPPTAATRENDGLLTASEIARMRFNADWVILSACNTAAGDAPGADGLSGLARAFFHAGARTLLVSHWPVGDRAALQLTTGAIRYLQEHPSAGKSEAFRQSMLQLLGDRSNPWNAHPRTWAPFVVVGENISYPAE